MPLNTPLPLLFMVLTLSLLTSCTTLEGPKPAPTLKLDPVSFSDLDGWNEDSQNQTLTAFAKSCARILKAAPDKTFGLGTTMADWQAPCRNMPDAATASPESARHFFETWFTPYKASDNGNENGLFTGYYEASLNGSLTQTGPYQTPLRARPDDLVMVNLADFRPELKGQRIAGRVKDGYLKPYEDRAAIENGKLPAPSDTPLYWIDNPVDVFFLQVQGSGVITLPDGTTQRVGYDGQNGYPYTAIGKELIARGELTKDTVSMQSIRAWLASHPSEAAAVMQKNQSYVFFKKLDTTGPVGGEGIVLTPERSMAVDRTIWPYGVPLFIAAKSPDTDQDLQQLMVAQDTGGAIIGVVRGDFFWGYGEQAAHRAGLMKSSGVLWALLPKSAKQPATE